MNEHLGENKRKPIEQHELSKGTYANHMFFFGKSMNIPELTGVALRDIYKDLVNGHCNWKNMKLGRGSG